MTALTALARARGLSCFEGRDVLVTPVGDVASELGLGEGRTNTNFIATEADGRRSFVRIGSDLPAFGVTRTKEQAAARGAASSGVGAAVLHTEPPDALVCELITGAALTEAELKSALSEDASTLLPALTSTLRRLHATPLPPAMAPAEDEAPCWAPPDLKRWLAYGRSGGFNRLPLFDDADALVAAVERFAGPLPGPPRFCHFDLLPDNFVVSRSLPSSGPPTVTVVDFEYANAGQPLMDLTVLAMGASLNEAEERKLLASYLELPALDEPTYARFGACTRSRSLRKPSLASTVAVLTMLPFHPGTVALKTLATLRETLWGVTAEVSGSSALTPAEAVAYTDQNYEKYLEARARFVALDADR